MPGGFGNWCLELMQDPEDHDHALILGLPSPYESAESFREANRLAQMLLEMSRPVDPL